MKIGEFSVKSGITIDTLRYYNKIGLLVPSKINERRSYTEAELEKAKGIVKLKNLNFSLDEIKKLFELEEDIDDNTDLNDESLGKISSCLEIITEKYSSILKQEQDLIQVKLSLKRMIDKTNKLLDLKHFFND